MKKNITILDRLGNMIGTTYPKRAKGLVKSGRAYTVDGETVQLICPPEKYMQKHQEDIDMDIETKKENLDTILVSTEKKEHNLNPITESIEKNKKIPEILGYTIENEETSEIEKKEARKEISEKAKKLLDAGISLKEILHNLNAIQVDSGYINQALNNLEKLPYITPTASVPIDTSIVARAEAIADIVKCRETTNQMMIKLYTQLYTDYMA